MSPNKSFEVVIIGSGSVGTPTAYFLAAAGIRTLVIDKFPSPGQGSNKSAIGGIRATHSDPAKIRLCLRSLDIISGWKDRTGDDLEWLKGGYSYVAYREEEEKTLKNLLAIQQSFGLNISWLDAARIRETIPGINPDGLIGGTLSPDDGHASPLLTIEAFYAHARRLGALFHFDERATGLVTSGGKVRGVRTDKGEYGADIVINAAGAWASEVAGFAGIDVPVNPDQHEGAVTEAVARFMEPMVVDIHPAPGSANYYFYQHATGQVVFCITPSPNQWGFDTRETSAFLPMVARRMVGLIPRLENLRVRRTWRGLYPMTPDAFPIIGRIKEVDGYVLAVGMCGQGYMLGPGIGEMLVRLVGNQLTCQDEEVLSYVSPYREFAGQEKLQ
jgi:sarcosine oxidase, subunit beta